MSRSSQYILQPNPSTHGNRADMLEKSLVPIITLTTYDLPIQLKNGSFLHWLEQPSPFIEFISSHSSPLELKRQEALLRKHSNPHCQTDKCRIRNKDIFFWKCLIAHLYARILACCVFESCESAFMLPLYASIPTVVRPQFVHQRWRGLTVTPAGDGLDLVGVQNTWQHIPAQTE